MEPAGRTRFSVRPLGGAPGCMGMIVFSIVASVVLTVAVNVLIRLFS